MYEVRQGEIWLANLPMRGSIQGGRRAVVITSGNIANKYSPVVDGSPFTTRAKNSLPVHVMINKNEGAAELSTILIEQDQPINKTDLIQKLGECPPHIMKKIMRAIKIHKGMIDPYINKKYIDELLQEIYSLDKIIHVAKAKNKSYDDELLEKGGLIAKLKNYCEIYNEDANKYLMGVCNHKKLVRVG